MKHKPILRILSGSALLVCPLLLGLFGAGSLKAQDQQSVADAARKAQAQQQSSKPAFVIDDDNLNSLKGTVSVVGSAPPEPEAMPDEKGKPAPAVAEKPVIKDQAYWQAKFAEARRRLADDAKEADILQREYNLKEQQYYSDPNTALREQYDRKDLNDTKALIDEKNAAVEQDKRAISDLEDQLRQSGGDPGWATEPSTPSSPGTSTPSTLG
jgi:hypothetical protein